MLSPSHTFVRLACASWKQISTGGCLRTTMERTPRQVSRWWCSLKKKIRCNALRLKFANRLCAKRKRSKAESRALMPRRGDAQTQMCLRDPSENGANNRKRSTYETGVCRLPAGLQGSPSVRGAAWRITCIDAARRGQQTVQSAVRVAAELLSRVGVPYALRGLHGHVSVRGHHGGVRRNP